MLLSLVGVVVDHVGGVVALSRVDDRSKVCARESVMGIQSGRMRKRKNGQSGCGRRAVEWKL